MKISPNCHRVAQSARDLNRRRSSANLGRTALVLGAAFGSVVLAMFGLGVVGGGRVRHPAVPSSNRAPQRSAAGQTKFRQVKQPVVSFAAMHSVIAGPDPHPEGGMGSSLEASTGLTSTDGKSTEPQVVRDGSVLREVDPTKPSQYLGGDFTFAGVDAYELNTDWNFNEGCGSMETVGQIDQLFSSLGPDAVVRVWFFQQFAIQQYGGPWDFAPMDRLIAAADQYGVHLIATLGNQDGTCDDGVWKDPSWYTTGWKTLDKNSGDNQVSFQQWVKMVVSRYASNPAILAWEPINEPRPDTCTLAAGTPGPSCWNSRVCPDEIAARDAVRGFFDQVGAEIHAIDPDALISDGALEEPGCGWNTEADWDYVESSPGIDLVSLHDYTGTTPETPQSMAWYTDEIQTIGKPVFAGEDGDNDSTPTCSAYQTEISNWQTKIRAEFGHYGLVGWLWWNWSPSNPPVAASICAPSTDPLMDMIQSLKQA
jgi:mannan endo-1,4-beta-mannosidase